MPCKKCACKSFVWNPVSALAAWQAKFGRTTENAGEIKVQADGVSVSWHNKTEYVKNTQDALRNCMCGHHWNYH